MAGKLITKVQQSHCAGLITGLVAALDARGFNWTKQNREDIEIAYRALGQQSPFQFANVEPPKPRGQRLFQRVRDCLGMP